MEVDVFTAKVTGVHDIGPGGIKVNFLFECEMCEHVERMTVKYDKDLELPNIKCPKCHYINEF